MSKASKSTIFHYYRQTFGFVPPAWVRQILGGLAVVQLTFLNSIATAVEVKGSMIVEGDATHVEFSGHESWDYNIERQEGRILLTVPKLDDATRLRLKSWNGPFVKEVSIEPGPDLKDRVSFQLTRQDIQYFDYLTDQPSRLILDFFESPDKIAADKDKAKVQARKVAEKKRQKAGSRGAVTAAVLVDDPATPPREDLAKGESLRNIVELKADKIIKARRSPASGELISGGAAPFVDSIPNLPKLGVYDGADPELTRFEMKEFEINEEAIIRSQSNIYLRFPMLVLDRGYLQKIWDTPPVYEVKADETDQNKKARLLLTLYNRKRYATFLATLEMFRKEYPETKYGELTGYLEADTYYELWKKDNRNTDLDRAISLYKTLLLEYPKAALAERTHMLIGYTYLKTNQQLNAIQAFEKERRDYPGSQGSYQAEIAVGEAYQSLKKFDESRAAFNEVLTDPKAGQFAIEAAFRFGDTYFEERKYDFAIAEYLKANQRYPNEWIKYPSAYYNTAEAYFWKSEYRKSLDAYREFLKRFPASTHGGYAMTRIGEILEIMGASGTKAVGAYLECLFRYKSSPGAQIAGLRLLSQRMNEMKDKDIERAKTEAHDFAEKSDLAGVKDFTSVILADGYFNRKDFKTSLEILEAFYHENTTSLNLDIFRDRIIKNITEEINQAVQDGNYIEAFKIYGKYASTWLKGTSRIDLGYFIGRSFEKAGVPDEAAKMYRQTLNSTLAIRGTPLEKKTRVFERIPSLDSLNLRLAAVAAAENDDSLSARYLVTIKDDHLLNAQEKVERVELESRVSEATGDLPKAKLFLKALIESWKGKPADVSSAQLRLAQLQAKTKEPEQAIVNLEKIIAASQDTENVNDEILARALELKGDLYLKIGKPDQAIKTYEELLEQFEDERPLGSVRYRIGKLYFDRGDLKSAEKTWSVLNRPETELWHKMALEEMEHSSWKSGYKKYLDRIPAMSGFDSTKK